MAPKSNTECYLATHLDGLKLATFDQKSNKVVLTKIKGEKEDYSINDMLYLQGRGMLILTDRRGKNIMKIDGNNHAKKVVNIDNFSATKAKVLKVSKDENSLLVSTNLNQTLLLLPDFLDRPDFQVKISLENNEVFQDFGFLGNNYVVLAGIDGSLSIYNFKGEHQKTLKLGLCDQDEEISCIEQFPDSEEILISVTNGVKKSKLVVLKAQDSSKPIDLEVLCTHKFEETKVSGRILKFAFSEKSKNEFYYVETTGQSLNKVEMLESGELNVSEVIISSKFQEKERYLGNGVLGAYSVGNTIWAIDFTKKLARFTIN